MHIFLSVASPERKQAEEVAYALRGAGHVVFLDDHELPAADTYHERIRQAIARADLMIYFVSPASVSPKRYTLSELRFAQSKWPHPKGRVLPVMVSRTPMDQVPPYLKAVSIFMPKGDLAAEVGFEVERMAKAVSAAGWGFAGGGGKSVGSDKLPPLPLAVLLFAGLGLIAGLITYALQRIGLGDSSLWVTSSLLRGSLFGVILCFMLSFLELDDFKSLIAAFIAGIAAFLISDFLMRSLQLFSSWDSTTRMVIWSILRAGIVVGVLALVFEELRDSRKWGLIIAVAAVSRLFHGSVRDVRSTEMAVSWAIWDAGVLAAICYVLWHIAASRQGNQSPRNRPANEPSAGSNKMRR